MKLSLYNVQGTVVGDVDVDDAVFGVPANVTLMHQAVVQQQANHRVGTASTKTRAQVAGTTKKMYKQKGTGRARHGSRKVPLWTGGGVAHGPHPRSYEQHMPQKMRRAAIRSALSVKARDSQIVVLDALTIERPRTKEMVGLLGRLPVSGKVLLTLGESNENIVLSARNIPGVSMLPATALNTLDLIKHDYLVATLPAIRAVEAWLVGNGHGEAPAEAPVIEESAPTEKASARRTRKAATGQLASAEESAASAEEAAAEQPAEPKPRARASRSRKSEGVE